MTEKDMELVETNLDHFYPRAVKIAEMIGNTMGQTIVETAEEKHRYVFDLLWEIRGLLDRTEAEVRFYDLPQEVQEFYVDVEAFAYEKNGLEYPLGDESGKHLVGRKYVENRVILQLTKEMVMIYSTALNDISETVPFFHASRAAIQVANSWLKTKMEDYSEIDDEETRHRITKKVKIRFAGYFEEILKRSDKTRIVH